MRPYDAYPQLVPAMIFVLISIPLAQCGSDDSTFVDPTDDGGASSSGTSGFVNTCDGPCENTTDDSGGGNTGACGDGNLAKSEPCDDGNKTPNDGCSATCTLEPGWLCPTPGLPCEAAKCGDGIIAGNEECEQNPPGTSVVGCSPECKIVPGYDCNNTTFVCNAVVCGDGLVQRGESCEDNNSIPFDGCFKCQKEPSCANGVCQAACGDGQRFASEQCDDGNTRSGDGCSATCTIETGFGCTDVLGQPPQTIDQPVLIRDFISTGNEIGGSVGHPDYNGLGGTGILNIVERNLDDAGRMVLNCPNGDCNQNPGHLVINGRGPNITTRANFDEWYRNATSNIPSVISIALQRQANTGTYVWDSADAAQNAGKTFFDPVGVGGWVNAGKEKEPVGCNPLRNVSFSSETHFWFEYQGGERFDFAGDDDTWVFVNNRLAIDLGGLHTPRTGFFVLDADTDGDAGADIADGGATFSSDMPQSGNLYLQLTKGGVYEVVMFQAERNECGSNFKVTLKDFNRPKSTCASTCGDGVKASNEACDDGKNDGSYGSCMPGCKARAPRCGDGILQADRGEQCDDGNTNNNDNCTNGCRTSSVK